MTMKNRIAALEKLNELRRFDFIEIQERAEPPTRAELERLRRELAIPNSVFNDLFGDYLRGQK